jgi:uncharacterized protein with HEPN domain
MQPEERDPAYLWDMLEAARDIFDFVENLSLDEFLESDRDMEMRRLALERSLEILGEAARQVSPNFCEAHPQIPLKDLVGLCNVISHQYKKVSYPMIYEIVREQIPGLISQLEPLIPPLPPLEE